jgi:hypothetical protein
VSWRKFILNITQFYRLLFCCAVIAYGSGVTCIRVNPTLATLNFRTHRAVVKTLYLSEVSLFVIFLSFKFMQLFQSYVTFITTSRCGTEFQIHSSHRTSVLEMYPEVARLTSGSDYLVSLPTVFVKQSNQGQYAIWTSVCMPKFRRSILPSSSM